jgi:CTP-dependent riboflavin kinase
VSSNAVTLEGRLCSGLGEGADFTALDWVERQFRDKLGYQVHPGTLNLCLSGSDWLAARDAMQVAAGIVIEPPPGFCAAKCFPVLIDGCVEGVAILPEVAGYPEDKLEIVAPVAVRQQLRLIDGDRVVLQLRIE